MTATRFNQSVEPACLPTLRDAPLDKSDARVRRMFGEIAARYDFLNHLLSLGIDRYWRWRTVRIVPPADSILDVCTGTGDLALAYHRAGGAQVNVFASDFCGPMLRVGQRKARKKAANRLAFFEADAQRLPFADNSFGVVSVAFGLRNISDTQRGLDEIVRVCRPAGKVAVLEFSMPAWQPFKALYGWYFQHVLPWIGQALARNRQDAYNYLPTSVCDFPFGEALADALRVAGLRDVRFYPLTFGIATLYVGMK